MAYVNFQDLGGASVEWRALSAGACTDPAQDGTDRLTELEWSVVALARRDGRGSLRTPGRLATALQVLFRQPNPRLADPRLEALRRLAVLTWHDGYAVPAHELRGFLAAGFTAGQYETMVGGIVLAKARRPEHRAVPFSFAEQVAPAHA